jgi:hypothetical protein
MFTNIYFFHQNVSYILLGFVSAAATMAACGLVLRVLIPTVYLLSVDSSPEDAASQIDFSNWGDKT